MWTTLTIVGMIKLHQTTSARYWWAQSRKRRTFDVLPNRIVLATPLLPPTISASARGGSLSLPHSLILGVDEDDGGSCLHGKNRHVLDWEARKEEEKGVANRGKA